MARPLGLARSLIIATLSLALVAAVPAAAQDPSGAPTDRGVVPALTQDDTAVGSQLEAALLTQSDLPNGFTSQDGIIQGSNFDLDQEAFDANNGLGIVSQVWQRSSDTGPLMVFDFRLLFPTQEDARNYLRDAEAVISERDASKLKLQKDEPPIGELHRLYQGTTEASGIKLAFNNHIFTVGPMAAKVFVSGRPGSAPGARRIAEAAAANMSAALEGVTPEPSPIVDPTPSPVPSGAPGPDVSSMFEPILVAHVGSGVDPTSCTPVKERAFAGELAAISCPIGSSGEILTMRQLDSAGSLEVAFESFKGSTPGQTGACETTPALEPRLDGGVTVGQLACYDATDGSRVFIWTDDRFHQIAWFVAVQTRPFADLWAQYLSAGPVAIGGEAPRPTPAPLPTPAPTVAPLPTPAPTGPAPTPQPVGSIPPGLTAEQAALAAHVPGSFVGSCRPTTINVDATASAALLCTVTVNGGDISVMYQQFPDQESMDAAYQDDVEYLGATRGSGACSGEWPAENTWSLGDQVAGRVACGEVGGLARSFAWTDDRLLISVVAETFEVSREDLHQWWINDSGPVS